MHSLTHPFLLNEFMHDTRHRRAGYTQRLGNVLVAGCIADIEARQCNVTANAQVIERRLATEVLCQGSQKQANERLDLLCGLEFGQFQGFVESSRVWHESPPCARS